MTALPTSTGPNWGRIAQVLGALGAGLSATGGPSPTKGGVWAGFGPAFQQALQGYQAQDRDREQFQMLKERTDRERAQFEADTEADRMWKLALGVPDVSTAGGSANGSTPMRTSGLQDPEPLKSLNSGDSAYFNSSGAQSPMSSFVAGLPPEQRAMLQMAGREKGMGMLADWMKPQDPFKPNLQTFNDNGVTHSGYFDQSGNWVEQGTSPQWQQQQGPGLTERERNAQAAGLVKGTPEYQQYILGRDDNEGGGPFEGNAMDAQASNILLTGNPASPEYAAAYAHLAQPKVQIDPQTNRAVIVSPDLSWARKPGQQADATGGAPLPLMPGVVGNRPGPTVQSEQSMPGVVQQQSGIPDAETFQVPGATITSAPGTGLSAADRSKLRNIRAEADSIKSALTRFKEVVKSSDWRSDLSAYGGGMTEGGRRLNSTYNAAALLTKAESLFNLGVLNGPDLELIRRTLPDPSTLPGLLTSEGASGVAVDEIISLIDNRLTAFESQFSGDAGTTRPPSGGTGGAPGGGTRVDQLPAGNWR